MGRMKKEEEHRHEAYNVNILTVTYFHPSSLFRGRVNTCRIVVFCMHYDFFDIWGIGVKEGVFGWVRC